MIIGLVALERPAAEAFTQSASVVTGLDVFLGKEGAGSAIAAERIVAVVTAVVFRSRAAHASDGRTGEGFELEGAEVERGVDRGRRVGQGGH